MVLKFDSPVTARDFLTYVGAQNDDEIHLYESALALAAVHHPSVVVDKYRIHMDKMASDLHDQFQTMCGVENGDGVNVRRMALANVFSLKYEYRGDVADYENLQNVDVMRVVDRRQGMPIALCIIGMALCRKMGWSVSGINFPGHFLMQMEYEGQRLIVDPFQSCAVLTAPDLRVLIKKHMGDDAELSSDYYVPCNNRDILLRLQNNIKYRLIESEHYSEALEIVDLMTVFAPDDNRLRLDLAVLLSRLGQPGAAIAHLQHYIDHLGDGPERVEAMKFMKELTNHIN